MKFSTFIFLLAIGILYTACNSVDFKKTSAGLPYKIFSSSNKADSIKEGDIVKLQVVEKIKDSVIFNTYTQKRASYVRLQKPTGKLTYADMGSNLMEILSKARKGDSIYIVQSTDSLINSDPRSSAGLKKGEQVTLGLRIADVYKTPAEANAAITKENEPLMKEEADKFEKNQQQNLERFRKDTAAQAQLQKDSKAIEDYLSAHHIQAQKTDWGVYVEVLTPGQGPKPAYGKYVTARYKGMHLSGETFDEGVFPIQIGSGGSIPGFEIGIRQLSKGEKARIYVPSLLAYGQRGSAPKIKPNENLIFELEILDISDTPPNQQPGR